MLQETLLLPAVRAVANPTVRGRERLRGVERPAVIVSNHASHLDTALLIEALPAVWRDRLAVGGAADYFFIGRGRGTAAALVMNAFPVERKRASAVSARLAVRLLQEGWSLILFPEGGRSEDGWLQEMKPGAAFAAAKAGRPIVPAWITGTEHILPKGATGLRRGRTDVLFGDPIFPEPGENPRELNGRLEAAMRRLHTEASSDWWTSLRRDGADPYGPAAARWRRIWARGEAAARPSSRWP